MLSDEQISQFRYGRTMTDRDFISLCDQAKSANAMRAALERLLQDEKLDDDDPALIASRETARAALKSS